MKGVTARQLFVKGEVLTCFRDDEGNYYCSTLITNDNNFVCRMTFVVKDEGDFREQFYHYINTDEFETKLKEAYVH